MGELLSVGIDVYSTLIIIRILISWIKGARGVPGAEWIYEVTEPPLGFARKNIPAISGIDFSPIWVLLGLDVIGQIVRAVL